MKKVRERDISFMHTISAFEISTFLFSAAYWAVPRKTALFFANKEKQFHLYFRHPIVGPVGLILSYNQMVKWLSGLPSYFVCGCIGDIIQCSYFNNPKRDGISMNASIALFSQTHSWYPLESQPWVADRPTRNPNTIAIEHYISPEALLS